MEQVITYESRTPGLWLRFGTRMIALLVSAFYGLKFLLLIFGLPTGGAFFYMILLIAWSLGIRQLWLDNPLRWRNKVTFDFQRDLIFIQQRENEQLQTEVLDFDGREIPFRDIEYYSTRNYGSFLFSSYFMVKIYVRGEEIKLLSFEDPNDFTRVVHLLKDRLQLPVK